MIRLVDWLPDYLQSTIGNTTSATQHIPCYAPKEFNVPRAVDLYINVAESIVLIVCVIGNILVVRGITLTPIKPVSYILIGNIAVTELLAALTYAIFMHSETRPWEWELGTMMCRFTYFLRVCSSTVISFTLAALAVYRCCVLTRPRIHLAKTRVNAYVIVLFSWLYGISIAIPFWVESDVRKFPHCSGAESRTCYLPDLSEAMKRYTGSIPFIAHFMGPLLVIAVSYGVVVFVLKRHIKRTTRNEELEMTENITDQTTDTAYNSHEDVSSAENDRRHSCKITKMEFRLLKIIYVIILIYLICYTPDNLIYLLRAFDTSIIKNEHAMMFRRHTTLLHALTLALHPICYGWMSGIIQRNFKCVMTNQTLIIINNVQQ